MRQALALLFLFDDAAYSIQRELCIQHMCAGQFDVFDAQVKLTLQFL